MLFDPVRRGRALAAFYAAVAPKLFHDLAETGLLPGGGDPGRAAQALGEWECVALYACVRGLIAAGGLTAETERALDALHEAVLEGWMTAPDGAVSFDARRTRMSARCEEYGAIVRGGGPATLSHRLGAAAAAHIAQPDTATPGLCEVVGLLHEALAEGAAEAARIAM